VVHVLTCCEPRLNWPFNRSRLLAGLDILSRVARENSCYSRCHPFKYCIASGRSITLLRSQSSVDSCRYAGSAILDHIASISSGKHNELSGKSNSEPFSTKIQQHPKSIWQSA
jgi:hypothetical protein